MDFSFSRICDAHPVGNRTEGALVVSIMTPLAEDYEFYQEDGKCVLESSREDGQVLIRLRDDESLGRELRTLLRTDKYIRTKDDGTLPATTKRIHRDLAEENRMRPRPPDPPARRDAGERQAALWRVSGWRFRPVLLR